MDSLATKLADFGPNGWGAKADRVRACLAVRSVVVAARIMIVYCGDGVLRFSFCSQRCCAPFLWPAKASDCKLVVAAGAFYSNARLCRVQLLRACTTVALIAGEPGAKVLHLAELGRAPPLGHVLPQFLYLADSQASGIVVPLGSTRLASAGRRAASRCACEAASSRRATQQWVLDDTTSGLDAPRDAGTRAQPAGQTQGSQ